MSDYNYVQYDFDQILERLRARVQGKSAWKDFYRSGTGEMLLELMAYCLNAGLYYTERTFQEHFLALAKNKSSIVNLVSLLNYIPKRKTSATGTLQFTLTAPTTKIVFIPKYTECQTSSGLKFLTNAPAAIQKGSSSVTVSGIQGELVTMNIVPSGLVNQTYTISDTSIENSADSENPTLNVLVDSVSWTKVSSFVDSDTTSTHYRLINNNDDTISIVFGNNINGLAPASTSSIVITYIRTDGLQGDITSTGVITTINNAIYDEDGTRIETISVSNASSFLGGDDEETGDEIRIEAPQVFKTGDRAVTKEDFKAIILNYPQVADVNVWGENEIALANGTFADQESLNTVYISVILQDWDYPDATFKSNLSAYVYNKSMLTVRYLFSDPDIIDVIPVLWLNIKKGYSLSQAQADVEDAIANEFVLGDTTKIGTIVKYSDIISAISQLEKVSYVNMDLEVYHSFDSTSGGVVDTLKAIPVEYNTCKLYIDGIYMLTDEDGVFASDGIGGYSIYGEVTSETGEIAITISPSPSTVELRYQQQDNSEAGNIIPSFNQVARLQSVDIQSIVAET